MLLGVVVVFVGSLFTSVVTSDMARRQAFAQADLARFAEAVRSAPYQACPSGTTYASAVSAVYQPGDARISDTTSYWQGGYAPSSLVPTGFSPACPGGGDLGVQQVTLTVTVGTGVSASTTVLKRNS